MDYRVTVPKKEKQLDHNNNSNSSCGDVESYIPDGNNSVSDKLEVFNISNPSPFSLHKRVSENT